MEQIQIVVDVQEESRVFIGKDTAEKIIYGTIIWFFHLVSDMAGSKTTAGLSGGTGISGPILSMAKELSALPFLKISRFKKNHFLSLYQKFLMELYLLNMMKRGKLSRKRWLSLT